MEAGGSTNVEKSALITSEIPLGKRVRSPLKVVRGALDSAPDDEPTDAEAEAGGSMNVEESGLIASETLLSLGRTFRSLTSVTRGGLGSAQATDTTTEPVRIDSEAPCVSEEAEVDAGGSLNVEESSSLVASETTLGLGRTPRCPTNVILGGLDSAQAGDTASKPVVTDSETLHASEEGEAEGCGSMSVQESALTTPEIPLGLGKMFRSLLKIIHGILGSTEEADTATEPVGTDSETPCPPDEGAQNDAEAMTDREDGEIGDDESIASPPAASESSPEVIEILEEDGAGGKAEGQRR